MRLWFYAVYLVASTGCRIPALEIQRQLGVTYKTAWRMCRQIRPLFDEEAPRARDEHPFGIGPAIATFVQAEEPGISVSR